METLRERSRAHYEFEWKVLRDGLGTQRPGTGESGAAGSSLLLQGSSVLCGACRSFFSGSSGQKEPLLLDQPFPLRIHSRVVAASLEDQDCWCPCFSVCGGCHCDRGRSSELDGRTGCCEESLLLVPIRVLAYTLCAFPSNLGCHL